MLFEFLTCRTFDAIKNYGNVVCSVAGRENWTFPYRDVSTMRLSKHEPVIYSYPVGRDFNSLTSKRQIRSIKFVHGCMPQKGNWREESNRRITFVSTESAAALVKPLLYLSQQSV